jgi:hypothetical protein
MSAEDLMIGFKAIIKQGTQQYVKELSCVTPFKPWCGLCASPLTRWIYEDRHTIYRTMEEAMPELRRNEQEQAITRFIFGRY